MILSKIYKLVVAKGSSPRWRSLPNAVRDTLWEKAEKVFKEVGGERIWQAESSWSSEEYPRFFIEVFPSVEALQKFTTELGALHFLEYFDVMTVVGTEIPSETSAPKPQNSNGKAKIYKLIIAKGQPHRWNTLPEAQRTDIWEKGLKAFEEVGGERPLLVDSSWTSEIYPYYFIETFPDTDALQKYIAAVNKLEMLQYFDVLTVVGTEDHWS